MHSRPKISQGVYDAYIPKNAYISKTADISNENVITFDKIINTREDSDSTDDLIQRYKVHFQTEPTFFEGAQVEKVRSVHRCVSTEGKGVSRHKERKKKLAIETKNPLLYERIRKYRELKEIGKSSNSNHLPIPGEIKNISTSDTASDQQDKKINRSNYNVMTKYKIDTETKDANTSDYCFNSQISFCDNVIPTLYDKDARRKSLLRNIRIQRLLNRLVILKARQKKKMNWINFIKELKIKHKLTQDQRNGENGQNVAALIDSYSSSSHAYVTRPYRTNTTANVSNLHHEINTSTRVTNPTLKTLSVKTSKFRTPRKTNTSADIRDVYSKYNIADTCNPQTSETIRYNSSSKVKTQLIDDFFNPKPSIERKCHPKFSKKDASFKFTKILLSEEMGSAVTYSTSSSNHSNATKKARKREMKEKFSDFYSTHPSTSASQPEQNFSISSRKLYDFKKACRKKDGEKLCSSSTQTDTSLKLGSKDNIQRNTAGRIRRPKASDINRGCILENDLLPEIIDPKCIMEAKIENILQSVNSLLSEIKTQKSKIIVEKEASILNKNTHGNIFNFNRNQKNCKRDIVLHKYIQETVNPPGSSKYKCYHKPFALYTEDKSIEVSKSLANYALRQNPLDDEGTDNIPVKDISCFTSVRNRNKNIIAMVRTILPSPYEAIKKIISYVPSLNYDNYLSLLPMPLALTSKPAGSRYLCNLCGARFENSEGLSRHIEQNHIRKRRSYVSNSHSVLNREGRKHETFRCRYCSQVFTSAYCCELHQEICAEKKSFHEHQSPSLLLLK